MNMLLLHAEEFASAERLAHANRVCLAGERARYLHKKLELRIGRELKIGLPTGEIGAATVEECAPERVILLARLTELRPPEPIQLIVAVSRPQIVKSVLRTAAMIGVRELMFIRTEQSDRSYFQSSALRPENLQQLLAEGCEQGVGGMPPEVSLHQSFRRFIEDELPAKLGNDSVLLCADQRGTKSVADAVQECRVKASAVLAIGPEAGWNDFERAQFETRGFQLVSLGSRVLRVDVALPVFVGQLQGSRAAHG